MDNVIDYQKLRIALFNPQNVEFLTLTYAFCKKYFSNIIKTRELYYFLSKQDLGNYVTSKYVYNKINYFTTLKLFTKTKIKANRDIYEMNMVAVQILLDIEKKGIING
jgi:hypothetical protein